MGRSLRTVTLEEAFRRMLRANYADRPALADEIQSYSWDWFAGRDWWFGTHLTSDEVNAVNEAFKLLDKGFADGTFRFCQVLGPTLQDIDPARNSRTHVFKGELYVFTANGTVTYRQVRCCEAGLPKPTGPKWSSEAEFARFVTSHLASGAPLTEDEITKAAKQAGIKRPRKDFRKALPPRPCGRRKNSPK
jgi:hypothetical protein